MNLHQIECVLAVAKYKSFSLAADSCYVSQSSLSQQISNLEKELGVSLFVRTTRHIQITEAGKTFVEYGNTILYNVNSIKESMFSYSNLLCGTINIGAITSLEKIHFSDLIADFYATYPKLSVNIARGESYSLLDALEKQSIDVAFLTMPVTSHYADIHFEIIGTDEYFLVVPEQHPLSKRKYACLQDFKNDRFIIHQPSQSVSSIFLHACNEAGFSPDIACRISASSIALNLIAKNIGIGIFASEELNYYRIKGIRAIPLKPPIKKTIVMATLQKRGYSPLTSEFLSFVRKRLDLAE